MQARSQVNEDDWQSVDMSIEAQDADPSLMPRCVCVCCCSVCGCAKCKRHGIYLVLFVHVCMDECVHARMFM
jgi:hypothetical protein